MVFFISTILTIIFPLCLGKVVPLDLVDPPDTLGDGPFVLGQFVASGVGLIFLSVQF